MRRKIAALILGVLFLLPSCAAPDGKSGGAKDDPSLTPLSQVIAEAANFAPGTYENLAFEKETYSVSVPEDLAHCTLREVGNFDLDYGEKLMHYWVPDAVWDERYVSHWDDNYAYAFNSTFDGRAEVDRGWYASVWCTGTVIYARDDGWAHFLHFPEVLDHGYSIDRADLDKTISLGDDELTLQDAVDTAAGFASDWLAQTDLQVTFRPKYIYVCTDDGGKKFVKINFQTCWNGVPISIATRQYDDPMTFTLPRPAEENGYTGDVELISVLATMPSKDDLDSFGGGHGTVELYDAGEVCEKMISLSTACDILSQSITSHGVQNIKDVALEYRLNIIGTDQPEDTYRYPDAETGELLPDRGVVQLFRTSYDLYEATPYWTFYSNDRQYRELIFYVNCLTGDVQILDNQRAR